ncbi:MAG TPA: hypothetical protein VKR42_05910 [Ktedonobacteraceae bacterium]|nr:hypothetical protein [Ktedonobacteraceae bacterium]
MTINDVQTWSFILIICAFVLFVQTLLVIRTLVLMRLFPLRLLPIVLIPLAISILAFVVSLGGYADIASLQPPLHIHISMATYQPYENAITQAVITRQIMSGFTVIIIALLAYFEWKMLPTVDRTPLWVRMRERRLTR